MRTSTEFTIEEQRRPLVNWKVVYGVAGDPHGLLIAEYNGVEFSCLYTRKSCLGISRLIAKRKLLRAIGLLSPVHDEKRVK